MIVMDGEEFLTAQETCALLGVKPATLYAYVSRGLLRSYRQGIKRMRLYRRNEVERLTRLRHPEGAENESENEPLRGDDHAWIPYVYFSHNVSSHGAAIPSRARLSEDAIRAHRLSL